MRQKPFDSASYSDSLSSFKCSVSTVDLVGFTTSGPNLCGHKEDSVFIVDSSTMPTMVPSLQFI